MEALIEIDGKKLTSIREASSEVSYSRDYVTRLAREGKIVASLIGRQWFVDCDSLKNYAAQSLIEAQLRKAQLSEERKQEQIFHKEKEQQESLKIQKHSLGHRKATVMAGLVLSFGVLAGVTGYSALSTQVSSVSSQVKSSQGFQSAANAHALTGEVVLPENEPSVTPSVFSRREVTDMDSAQNGILLIPTDAATEPTSVFSDEVEIRTASSGQQSAVLISRDGRRSEKEIPFVVVPVKTQQN